MRHQRRKRVNLNRGRRKGVFSSLLKSLFTYGRVNTSLARAKQVQSLAEKLITLAKEGTVASRRRIYAHLQNETLVKKLVDEIAPRFAGRNGGYTQLLKLKPRIGDGCPLARLSLLP